VDAVSTAFGETNARLWIRDRCSPVRKNRGRHHHYHHQHPSAHLDLTFAVVHILDLTAAVALPSRILEKLFETFFLI